MEAVAENTPPEAPRTVGAAFRAARENLGMSLADAARQLRLSARQVEALEADDYAHLPSAIFVRGFIRNYAKLLQIDAEPLLAQAGRVIPAKPESVIVPQPHGAPFPTGRERFWRQYAMVGVVLALGIPFVVYELVREPEPVKTAATTPATPAAVAVAPAVTQAVSPAVAEAAPAGPANESQAGVVAHAVAAPPVPGAAAGAGQIRLAFDRESWVEIHDGRGQRILSQLNPAGTVQVLRGEPPFSLIIGNAAHVRLAYNDKAVDLTPHIKVEVARLTLE